MNAAGSAIGRLLRLGVKDFVVCAGARNASLALILLEQAELGRVKVWRHFDERSAAFFSLGLAKKDRRPVAVVTTSGTAAAEVLPAIIEAHYSAVPLIALTADRPRRFRKSGAPQAIEQEHIFGGYVSCFVDAEGIEDLETMNQWDGRGPLQVNLCLEEPVADEAIPEITWGKMEAREISTESSEKLAAFLQNREGMIALVGELAGGERDAVKQFLKQLGIPTWFEATSGLREAAELSRQRVSTEGDLSEMKIARVLRIGGVPSLRFWRELESSDDIAVFSICPTSYPGLSNRRDLYQTQQGWVHHMTGISPESHIDILPTNRQAMVDSSLKKNPASEPGVIRTLSEHIPSDALVFLGNSMPIRQWNLAASFEKPHPHCFANRGANGIDGELSAFFGLCQDFHGAGAWGLFGDLTTLYDLNAPYLLDQLSDKGRNIRLVVLNNGGGRIFSRLPAMAHLDEKQKQLTENHHQIQFQHWAAMWGMGYARWDAGAKMPEADGRVVVIEVVVDNQRSEEFWEGLRQ